MTVGKTPKKPKDKKQDNEEVEHSFSFETGEIECAIVPKVVQKLGNRWS